MPAKKCFSLAIMALVVVLTGTAARAQVPGSRGLQLEASVWKVRYWNNTTLSGDPAATSTEADLDHDWGGGSPHANVNADRFSARWERRRHVLRTGTYRFTATADDGIRVYVDGHPIIDEWRDQPPRTFTADVRLEAGSHLIAVEYYENQGGAVARVDWAPIPAPTDGWHATYFDDSRGYAHPPVLERTDAELDLDWGYGAPGPGVPSDRFSAQWTRTLHLEAGTYRFAATSDDGMRVYVDGRLVIDEWHDHAAQTHAAEVDLSPGIHRVRVEYYERGGMAVARLSWLPIGGSSQWQGEYFANRSLEGAPASRRAEAQIDFNWGYGSPGAGLPRDGFSARWTRTVHFEPGSYRFTATTDDGVRLWVDGHPLIDAWVDQPFRAHSGTIYLSGDVLLKMEYYENRGVAAAKLTWQPEWSERGRDVR